MFGVNKDGHTYINSGNNHIGLNVQSNTDSHIQLKTKNDDNKNVYLINRDGHFRLHQHGVGDMFGVNKDGHHYVRHTGDHVMHVEGDGNNPYISLGKTGTWDKKKLYIQNVDAHTENPTFRVGTHGGFHLMDMNKSHGTRWQRKDGRWTHLDWENGMNYIRGNTQHDGDMNVSGKLRLTHGGSGGDDDSDPYHMEKIRAGGNNNSLRLTINDDADESFQIWGNSCGAGDCGGPGTMQHYFGAAGNVVHKGPVTATKPAGWSTAINIDAPHQAESLYSLHFGNGTDIHGRQAGMGYIKDQPNRMWGATRGTLGMHIHQDDDFHIYSSGWDPLFSVKGGSGDMYVKGGFHARKNNYLYYPENAKIYQEVFDALKDGTLAKSGNPAHWDQASYAVNPWEGRKIIRLGGIDQTIKFPNGGMITVPNGYNVIWIRILGDRWACVQVYNEKGENLGNFSGGYNKLNRYAPDGGTSDTFWHVHEWMSIPVPGPGKYILGAGNNVNDGGRDLWISGVAFSTNPWNHAYNSAVAYHWAVNGGTNLGWETHDWNNAPLARIEAKSNIMIVPNVYSGKDKLLYIVEHNNNWDGMMHKEIKVEDQVIERFRTTWDHPLARHHNSKFYNRFAAARIPANLTNKRFLKVEINNVGVNHSIYIREAGTIDMY